MQVPLTLSFEGMDPSDAIEYLIRKEWKKLEPFQDRLIAARVAIARPTVWYDSGGSYWVRIHLMACSGIDIYINCDPKVIGHQENVSKTIADAFDAALQQLRDAFRPRKSRAGIHEAVLSA